MNQAPVTLSQFFAAAKGLSPKRLSLIESSEAIASLKEILRKEARVKWPAALGKIAEKVPDILDIGVPDILVSAWSKSRLLAKYRDREKYPPQETFLVPLAEHTINSEHHPFLEILVNGKSVGKIKFTITLSLKLEGIVLKIQDGRIREAATGTCQGKGALKYENHVILEKAAGSISLPGSIDLGEGLPIIG